jgi:hypothetical protein
MAKKSIRDGLLICQFLQSNSLVFQTIINDLHYSLVILLSGMQDVGVRIISPMIYVSLGLFLSWTKAALIAIRNEEDIWGMRATFFSNG